MTDINSLPFITINTTEMLIKTISSVLDELVELLDQLNPGQYTRPCPYLSGSTIGQHSRHIIELFQCLLQQYDSGVICYDLRPRQQLIETLPDYASQCIEEIKNSLTRPEKQLTLVQQTGESQLSAATSYSRELLYNFEHCIHHQALIKVAIHDLDAIRLSENFGVAPSTIKARR